MKVLLLLAALLSPVAQAGAAPIRRDGKPRTVMVQLFEWPWRSVAQECETTLGPKGFSAVQVSPATEHASIPGHPWWERYQPVSYRLESRSGTEAEFQDMVSRCHAAGVDVYVDVVLNHMAGREEGMGYYGSMFGHYEYSGLYSYDDFHHCGRNGNDDIVNFHDLYELQNCELLNLADIDTGKQSVQLRLAGLLNHLLDMGVAGFRIDAAKHMAASDLAGIFGKVTKPFYAIHELIISPGEPVDITPYLPLGDVNVFPYAYGVGAAFLNGDMHALVGIENRLGVRSADAVVLLENHDLERRPPSDTLVPFSKQPELNALANVFMLTYPYGYPQLFSGYSFEDYDLGPPMDSANTTVGPSENCGAPWTCSHRSAQNLALVNFRNLTNKNFFVSDIAEPKKGMLAYGRGALGHVVINDSANEETVKVPTQLPKGKFCNILSPDCRGHEARTDGQGNLELTVGARSAFVILNQ